MSDRLLAGIEPSPLDQRDIPYRSPFTPEALPNAVDMRSDVFEIENQGSIGSCVANCVCSGCEVIANQNSNPVDLSRMFLYNATKAFEGRLGQSGLYTRDAFKVSYKYGICLEEGPQGYPYDLDQDDIDPPEQFYQLAFDRRVQRYEAVVRSSVTDGDKEDKIHRIKSALHEGMVVVFGMPVTDSLFNLSGHWSTHQYQLESADNPKVGGHCMYAVGYDANLKLFLCANSWGTDYGDGGFMGLPFDIVDEFFFEAYVIRDFDGMEIQEQPGIRLEFLNKFRMNARIIAKPEEVGQSTKIWMGAIYNGQPLLRAPIPLEMIDSKSTDFSGGSDVWRPLSEGTEPVVSGYKLDDDNYLRVVMWVNLTPFVGADFYIGYGDDLTTATIEKICTIPENL